METVALAGDDLRSHVVGRPYDGIGSEPSFHLQFLGRAHIDQSEKPISIHHQILRLEVTVYDPISMQMLHHQQHLRHQLTGVLSSKGYHLGDDVEQILSLDELHDEIDEIAVLYQFVEGDHEGEARDGSEDLLLVHDVLDYLRFLDVGTIQDLYRVHTLSLDVPTGIHLAEVPLTQLTHHVEVRDLHLFLKSCTVLLTPLLCLHTDGHRRWRHLNLIQ